MILSFKEYIIESTEDEVINIDGNFLTNNIDKLNSELDVLTQRPYQNAPIFLVQLRGTLERYGIQLPQKAVNHFLNLSSELVYGLNTTHDASLKLDAIQEINYHLYIVFDTNDDGYVDGYAQIVDENELNDLLEMTPEDYLKHNPLPKPWIPPARKDDDSGNDAEYA